MLLVAMRNLICRPLRSTLTAAGLALAVAVMAGLSAFGEGYRRSLDSELSRMGMQMMLVPLGCPYDAAARVLKGRSLEHSLPEAAVLEARSDPAVAVAAPMLLASVPRPAQGRTDLWAGIDEAALQLKPWWDAKAGERWFTDDDSVILGAEAAEVEMRSPGDLLYSPEAGRSLRVVGVLARSGTSDDSLFFVSLRTAQQMFDSPGRITAVAIRLHDPEMLREASGRLQEARGAQVVTMTEMMGAFLNLVGSVRSLLVSVALVAVTASGLIVFNTLLGSVLEQTRDLAVMRAVGASRVQVFVLIGVQAGILTGIGGCGGLLLAALLGPLIEQIVRGMVPLAPSGTLLSLTAPVLARGLGLGLAVGLAAGVYPAWQASRVQPALAMRLE